MSKNQPAKKSLGRPRKGRTPGGKTFGEVRDNMSLITRVGKLREAGASFAQIEKDLGLRPCSGMTAYRCFQHYKRVVGVAKKKVKAALKQVAGSGRLVIGDEPPTDDGFDEQLKKDIALGERLEAAVADIKNQYRERWRRAIEKATEVVRSEMEE